MFDSAFGSEPSREGRCPRLRLARWGLLTILVVGGLGCPGGLVAAAVISRYAGLLDLVRRGDLFGEEAMREEACRGVDAAFLPPPCDARTLRPQEFQEGGFNPAYIHSPGYYVVAGFGGRLVDRVPGVSSPVVGARLMGALWLGGGRARRTSSTIRPLSAGVLAIE